MSVARMNDVYMFAGMIDIQYAFKECCILSKADVIYIFDHFNLD